MVIEGTGQYRNRNQSEWRTFTFACAYTEPSSETQVAVRWLSTQ
jgi:hypothetical protein